MRWLGVDPGATGAWTVLDGRGAIVAVEDLPFQSDGTLDGRAWAERLREHGLAGATVEEVGHIPFVRDAKTGQVRRKGVQGNFNFGRTFGGVLATLDLVGIPRWSVKPDVWKRAYAVTSVKATTLAAARSLWPDCAAFGRVKDHDRAESALIARYGQRTHRLLGRAA